jgi:methylisocitrate lyase
MIIGRTNGVRSSNMDDALRRAEAYRAAGAEMILISPRTPEELRHVGERLGAPLMISLQGEGLAETGLTVDELGRLGYRVLTISTTAFAFHRAMKQTYESIARGVPNPVMAGTGRKAEQEARTGRSAWTLLAVEKATVEK